MKSLSEPAEQECSRRTADLPRLPSLAVLVAGFLVLFVAIAQAAPARKLVGPGQLLIDGYLVRCGSTPALISESYPDYGAARRGLIILNPRKLRHLPRGAKLMIYFHECAHQYVGGSELAADCWAAQKVRRDGLMDRKGLENACSFIRKLPANRRHPPGAMRCRHMMRCYNDTFRAKADKGPAPVSRRNRTSLSSSGFSRPGARLKSKASRRR